MTKTNQDVKAMSNKETEILKKIKVKVKMKSITQLENTRESLTNRMY